MWYSIYLLDWLSPETKRILQEPINSMLFIDYQAYPREAASRFLSCYLNPFYSQLLSFTKPTNLGEGYRGRPSTDVHSWDTSKNAGKMKKYL